MFTYALTKNIKAKLYSIFEDGVEIIRSLSKKKVFILLEKLNESRSTGYIQSDRVCEANRHSSVDMPNSRNTISQTRIHCPSTQMRSESKISSVSTTRAITCDRSNSTDISASTRELFAKSRETNTSPFDSILRRVTDSYRTVTDSYRTICNDYKSLNRAMLNSLVSSFEQSNGCNPTDHFSGLFRQLEPTTIEITSIKNCDT